jgi:hypothetical protein
MPVGDTFRMNVSCTKPYNADQILWAIKVSNRRR